MKKSSLTTRCGLAWRNAEQHVVSRATGIQTRRPPILSGKLRTFRSFFEGGGLCLDCSPINRLLLAADDPTLKGGIDESKQSGPEKRDVDTGRVHEVIDLIHESNSVRQRSVAVKDGGVGSDSSEDNLVAIDSFSRPILRDLDLELSVRG